MSDTQNVLTQRIGRYGVMGYPVAHSRSPVIHTVFARQSKQQMVYEALEVAPDDLEQAIRQFQRDGGRGLNITVPHKSEVVRLVDELSETAAAAGAVNTLTIEPDQITGDNTDGIGLVRDIGSNRGWPIENKKILILGAGGATRGIVQPLMQQKPISITLANRTAAKAVALASHFSRFGEIAPSTFERLSKHRAFDLVINATSAGLDGKRPAFPANIIGPATRCYDLAYGSGSTPFLGWAGEAGALDCASGWGMLVEQAAESFKIWRGVAPDTHELLRG